MRKMFFGFMLSLIGIMGVKAQANEHRACLAKSTELLLKFKLDYSDDTYHLLLRNIKGSTDVTKVNDKFTFETKGGAVIVANLTEGTMKNSSDDGYYKVVLIPEQVSSFSKGLTSVSLVRDDNVIPFALYEQTSNDIKNEVKLARKDSVQVEMNRIAMEKDRISAEEKQKSKEAYEAWLASRTPEYLASVKDFSIVYAGYSRNFDAEDGINGLTIGCSRAFNVTKRAPVFLEFGLKLDYYHRGERSEFSDIIGGVKTKIVANEKINLLAFAVPINVSYKCVSSNGVIFQPYVGFSLNFNPYAKMSLSTAYEVKSDDTTISDKNEESIDLSIRKFLFGGQIGFRIGANHWFGGVEYRRLTPYYRDANGVNIINATVGYMF